MMQSGVLLSFLKCPQMWTIRPLEVDHLVGGHSRARQYRQTLSQYQQRHISGQTFLSAPGRDLSKDQHRASGISPDMSRMRRIRTAAFRIGPWMSVVEHLPSLQANVQKYGRRRSTARNWKPRAGVVSLCLGVAPPRSGAVSLYFAQFAGGRGARKTRVQGSEKSGITPPLHSGA